MTDRNRIIARLYDKNGDKTDELQLKANASWEWNRRGGCGQSAIVFPEADDNYIHDKLRARAFIEIFTRKAGVESKRYAGKLIRPIRVVQQRAEMIQGLFYGFIIDLQGLTVVRDYAGQGIKTIIEDVLDTDVLPYSDITYDSADIDDPGYSIESISLNHTVQDAFVTLAAIAGNYEWGVDADKKFFFKATDTNVKHVYVLGRDVINFIEERQDDQIFNELTIHGDGGINSTISSQLSINKYGTRKSPPLYDHSIGALSDLNRLGISILKNIAGARRSIKFDVIKDDLFVEETLPLGAAAVSKKQFRNRPKYGTNFKYGRNKLYGNLKRDQFQQILYQVRAGGMFATAVLIDDIPNIGDLQKRFEFEIKELQRR